MSRASLLALALSVFAVGGQSSIAAVGSQNRLRSLGRNSLEYLTPAGVVRWNVNASVTNGSLERSETVVMRCSTPTGLWRQSQHLKAMGWVESIRERCLTCEEGRKALPLVRTFLKPGLSCHLWGEQDGRYCIVTLKINDMAAWNTQHAPGPVREARAQGLSTPGGASKILERIHLTGGQTDCVMFSSQSRPESLALRQISTMWQAGWNVKTLRAGRGSSTILFTSPSRGSCLYTARRDRATQRTQCMIVRWR